ncbi:MAG: hypothetical protein KC464_13915 [Myxococcales bacterium]|nr:hypothetical protein [Myxococcales bacterium]
MLGLAMAACSPGSVGGDDTVAGDDGLPELALCEAQLNVSGTFAPEGTPPTPDLGCVPQGTWTVTMAVADAGTCGDVPALSTHVYTVTGEGRDEIVTYNDPATGEEVTVGVHSGGNGECEGSFEHIWAAPEGYHVLLLKPYFEPGTQVMLGSGSYQLWSAHP